MGIFKKMSTEGLEQEADFLGGRKIYPSDIYKCKIQLAYATFNDTGSASVSFTFSMEDGSEYSETVYVTSRKGDNFYTDKKGKKRALPGFTTVNDICMMTTEQPLSDQETQDKVIRVYDPKEKGEINKSVPVLTNLLGKDVAIAIAEEKVFKQVKTDSGYVDGDEVISINRIAKVFHPTLKVTLPEALNNEEPKFWDSWTKVNSGRVIDRTTRRRSSGSVGKSGPSKAPKTSLFGK